MNAFFICDQPIFQALLSTIAALKTGAANNE
jgi:hypothetical protein